VVTNGVLKTDVVGLIGCAHGTCGRSRVCQRAAPPEERLTCFRAQAVRRASTLGAACLMLAADVFVL
jgi:hypothetical protein